jgi:flagellar assembly protein FliH
LSKGSIFSSDTVGVTSFSALLNEAHGTPARRMSATDRQRSQLESERSQALRQGYDVGFQEGIEAGRKTGRDEGFLKSEAESKEDFRIRLEQFSQDLGHVEDLVVEGVHAWFGHAENQLEALVTDIAREVIREELKISRESVLAIVRRALEEVTLSRQATIRVNPLDVASLRESKELLIASASSLRSLEIVDDPSILGGCVIETDGGAVDATVDGQLARLEVA